MTDKTLSKISKCRTFAIISHPDAGKTTLTEKLLLYGGAKDLAGGVRDRKNASQTSSDWLELEKQRGISVSSTVLQFTYRDFRINLLDTPGHRDFSEDTYRVLMAVDTAIMVIDTAKGIEPQTLKLFQVCRLRGIPIVTFVNKCDRPSRDPLELLDEIENQLGLETFAVNLPVGEGAWFSGVYDRLDSRLHLFERVAGGRYKAPVKIGDFDDPVLKELVAEDVRHSLLETAQLLDHAGHRLDLEAVERGTMTPVFFGSAVNNFGVQLLLDGFLKYANPPTARSAQGHLIPPDDERFSAIVFKIQANMDPNHRDRLIFLRICSGRFERDLKVVNTRNGKSVRLRFAHQLFGRDRNTSDEAWAGDILGITGQTELQIGDTLSTDPDLVYDPIPRFAPECFIHLHLADSSAHKGFRKGLDQLLEEKVVQQFFPLKSVSQVPLLGAVGPLQFDVVKYRLQSEYNVDTRIEPGAWQLTRWVNPEDESQVLGLSRISGCTLARDEDQYLCILFETNWNVSYFQKENPGVRLSSSPFYIRTV